MNKELYIEFLEERVELLEEEVYDLECELDEQSDLQYLYNELEDVDCNNKQWWIVFDSDEERENYLLNKDLDEYYEKHKSTEEECIWFNNWCMCDWCYDERMALYEEEINN